MEIVMEKKAPRHSGALRSIRGLRTLDDFLMEERILESVTENAKRRIADMEVASA